MTSTHIFLARSIAAKLGLVRCLAVLGTLILPMVLPGAVAANSCQREFQDASPAARLPLKRTTSQREIGEAGLGLQTIDLAGMWTAQLVDGQSENGERSQLRFSVKLPGALRDSDVGSRTSFDSPWIGEIKDIALNQKRFSKFLESVDFKNPYWWQPNRRHVGVARYRRNVDIPANWSGQRIELLLERPHWQTRVLVDGTLVGEDNSLGTPHRFDLSDSLTTGSHELEISIDNRIDRISVGENAHSVSDHTQTAWHGLVGRLELRMLPVLNLDRVHVHPAADENRLRLLVDAYNSAEESATAELAVNVMQNERVIGRLSKVVTLPVGETVVDATLALDSAAERWDEFNPALCTLVAELTQNGKSVSRCRETFGLRKVSTAGTRILINDQPVQLRGTLECCVFPLTGYPPTDVPAWRRIVRTCKSLGLNHMRFHSWCPPKAAFVAADELGFYYQVECSTWATGESALGRGRPIDNWLYRECERVLADYGNHPSLVLVASGNEAEINDMSRDYLSKWVAHFDRRDDRMLFTSASGWPLRPENQFHVSTRPRIHQWGQGLVDRLNSSPPETQTDYRTELRAFDRPVISHELGQWSAFPNLAETQKFTGTLRPTGYEIIRELLSEKRLLNQASQFTMSSGKLQVLTYKEEVESLRRTPGAAGFQLLDLRDFPGQGLAPVGMLDVFWDPKPYVDADEIRRFCGPVVPLARMAKRVWENTEIFRADIELSHFGPSDFASVPWNWTISSDAGIVATGSAQSEPLKKGSLDSLGTITWDMAKMHVPAKCRLTVNVPAAEAENDWEFWVYPSVEPPADLAAPRSHAEATHVTTTLDSVALTKLRSGGSVLWLADHMLADCDSRLGFSPIFWNQIWTQHEPPHTLGIHCDPSHDLFQSFPNDGHSNWNWWGILNSASPMNLDGLPVELEPLVQVIPGWYEPSKLALIFECQLEQGRLVVASIDLENNLSQRPAARQLRKSILRYMDSESFTPQVQLTRRQIESLFVKRGRVQQLGVTAVAGSAQNGFPAEHVVDGDPNTMWHASWSPAADPGSDWVQFELNREVELTGVRCLPRSDRKTTRILEYEVAVSVDGNDWTIAASGQWSRFGGWKTVRFDKPVAARFVKLTSGSEHEHTLASLAEFDVIVAETEVGCE